VNICHSSINGERICRFEVGPALAAALDLDRALQRYEAAVQGTNVKEGLRQQLIVSCRIRPVCSTSLVKIGEQPRDVDVVRRTVRPAEPDGIDGRRPGSRTASSM
jgi:hypothetical protein